MLAFIVALSSAAAAPPEATPPPAEPDPIICSRKWRSEVGTHLQPKKVCLRKSDWDLMEDHTKETLQSINDRGNNPGMADGHRPQ